MFERRSKMKIVLLLICSTYLCAQVEANDYQQYDGFVIEIPLYPSLFILQKIQVVAGGYITPDSFVLDRSRLDIDYLRSYLGANQSDESNFWMVKEVEHDHKAMKTKIIVSSFN